MHVISVNFCCRSSDVISQGNRERSLVFSGHQIFDPVQKRPVEPPAVCLQLFFTCFSFCLDCDKPSRITTPPVSRGRPFIFESSLNQYRVWQHAHRHCQVTCSLFQSQRERNGAFPSFQTPHFQNEVKCKTCHVKMSFICITSKFHFCIGLILGFKKRLRQLVTRLFRLGCDSNLY